jgi:membrane-bound lytic murein transglycosylase B
MKIRLFHVAVALLVCVSCARAIEDVAPVHVDVDSPEVAAFVDEMVSKHEFERDALRRVLSQAEIKPSIIKKISTPAERTLTWGEYRKIFITKERIKAGVAFWRENREMLERISAETGVSIEMIVGIIGVETYFGRITGKDRVLDALATLAFAYPKRAKFFRPQFMPSSFRAYAVDATGDGKRDIWNDWADVAGSVANYFLEHGWRANEDVTAQATLGGQWKGPAPEPKNTLTAGDTVETLSKNGVVFATDLCADSKGELLTYEGSNGTEHWVGFHNFFVITKYNRSNMYALAAHQLGQEIASQVETDGG